MSVDAATTPHHARHAGVDYHFCAARCRERFVADPVKYLTPAPAPADTSPAERGIYTCPMHPEIRQDHPGSCPINIRRGFCSDGRSILRGPGPRGESGSSADAVLGRAAQRR